MKSTVLALVLATASAVCPNSCSGHGTCGIDDVCSCYDNWHMGDESNGDCSDRRCPYEIAWADGPDSTGSFHGYAECAGKGICDRSSGECECFDGYEGKACARQTCPNDCSGHGTCEFAEEKGYGSVVGESWDGTTAAKSGIHTSGSVSGGKTFSPEIWDKGMSRVCVCDPQYTDVDCSRRMCPKANDVMDERLNTADAHKYQVQNITLFMGGAFGNGTFNTEDFDRDDFTGQTFALTFKSTINETFTTIPLKFNASTFSKSVLAGAAARPAFGYFATQVKNALQALPNEVIDEVDVECSMAYVYQFDGGDGIGGDHLDENYLNIQVTFKGAAVSGRQNLLMVEADMCGDGCTPKLTGLDLKSWAAGSDTTLNTYMSFVSEKIQADHNNYECGRRGKCDYSDGTCECFSGFTGESCATQTALV